MREFANFNGQALAMRLTGRAGLAMLFAAVLAFLAPFGTYRFAPIERVGYWTSQMVAWLVLSAAASWFVLLVPGLRSRGHSARLAVATIIAALPMMVVTGTANNMMNGWQPTPGEVLELFLSIALIGGTYSYAADRLLEGIRVGEIARLPVAEEFVGEARSVNDPAAAEENGPTDTALINRLPTHIRSDIICLQVEDHYVRVHSRQSSAMVLMRFSDALRGVDHIAGSQVHRSWWVASDAVAGLRRTGRTAQLTLSNGVSVPVSQPYLAHATSVWGALGANAI